MPPLRLVLVRHAQSQNNVAHGDCVVECGGDLVRAKAAYEERRSADPDLSALGYRQAAVLGRALGPTLAAPDTLLVASPMRRSLLTAAAIAEVGAVPVARFRCQGDIYEIGGAFVGQTVPPTQGSAALEAAYAVHCRGIPEAGWDAGPDRIGAETVDQSWVRLDRVMAWTRALLDEAAAAGWSTVVIVVHGDLMSRWLRKLLEVPWHRAVSFVHGNTGITTLRCAGGAGGGAGLGPLLLEGVNDLGHLAVDERSGLGPVWWHYSHPDVDLRAFESGAEVPPSWREAFGGLREVSALGEGGGEGGERTECDERSAWWVARVRGEIAAAVSLDPLSGRLRPLVVAPAFAGQGLEERLLAAAAATRA